MAVIKNIAGLTIGDWYVIERGPVVNDHTMWRCRCKCGTIKLVDGYSLTHEISLSCGCRRHQNTGRPAEDASGKLFGRTTAQRRISGFKRPRYECKCVCGKIHTAYLSSLKSGRVQSCGCYRSEVAAMLNWKGGVHKENGYVAVYDPENPNARRSGYILLHRKIMQQTLGRPLRKGETVHHKNGIKDDNSPSNLELRSGNHGPGAGVVDILRWSVSMLKEYWNDLSILGAEDVKIAISGLVSLK